MKEITLYFNLDTNPLFENDLYRSDLLRLIIASDTGHFLEILDEVINVVNK